MKNAEEGGAKHKPPSAVHTPKASLNLDATPGSAVAANHAAAASPAPTTYGTTEVELERLRKTVLRFERTLSLNGWAQAKLPSPLNELHYLKEQMPANQFDLTVRETYQREIAKYLVAARHQARHSNVPTHLPGILDGLDVLRTSPQPMQLSWSLKETYDFVLRAYLQLLEPSPFTATAESARKRKRDEAGSEKKDDEGEKDEESKDEEMDTMATV
uniref:Uncharacterized protein n=1 Tax=Amphora coffeiformis TaxID=265554 RepID=A0A7S3LA76_9STRA